MPAPIIYHSFDQIREKLSSKNINKYLTLAATEGCLEMVEFLLTSGKCNISEAICNKKLQKRRLSEAQKKCWKLVLENSVKLTPIVNEEVADQKQLIKANQRKSLPILPFEMLEKIASFITNGSDFMNWLRAFEKYPSIGNFKLILDFQKENRLKDCDLWPELNLKENLTDKACQLLGPISSLFKEIIFHTVNNLQNITLEIFIKWLEEESDEEDD